MLNGSVYVYSVSVTGGSGDPSVGRLAETRWRSIEGFRLDDGNRYDDWTRANARAWFSRASAAATLWFAFADCCSSSLSSGVLKIVHQSPFGRLSAGDAAWNGAWGCTLHCAGVSTAAR